VCSIGLAQAEIEPAEPTTWGAGFAHAVFA